MPDLHKTLILAHIREDEESFSVEEMAIATEHAPFRHKNTVKGVGSQVKKAKTDQIVESDDDRKWKDEMRENEGHDDSEVDASFSSEQAWCIASDCLIVVHWSAFLLLSVHWVPLYDEQSRLNL